MKGKFLTATAAVVLASATMFGSPAKAAPVAVDVTFVIDSSGSMGGEFTFLGSAIGEFLGELQAAPKIGDARAALVNYTAGATLVQGLTSNVTALENAFASVGIGGGTENAYSAVDAAITDLGIDYRSDAVKSIILITDEDADDVPGYTNTFSTPGSTSQQDLLALLNANNFLLNIIYDFGFRDRVFRSVAQPDGAVFDIVNFRNNRQQFFDQFTEAKIEEIQEKASPVPAPSAVWLFAIALLALGGGIAWRRRTV